MDSNKVNAYLGNNSIIIIAVGVSAGVSLVMVTIVVVLMYRRYKRDNIEKSEIPDKDFEKKEVDIKGTDDTLQPSQKCSSTLRRNLSNRCTKTLGETILNFSSLQGKSTFKLRKNSNSYDDNCCDKPRLKEEFFTVTDRTISLDAIVEISIIDKREISLIKKSSSLN
ncbi:uncharacterized protein LOC124819225 isoform X1 [Hydra vulgaris]|uniref:uncharacterized protein LOC124819225 isoform X1 n=1 Tax=Hydra vulgaris TaxID=6087 RepID=UPI001F5FC6E4|nr:uncharacterized protein LOC124819225 [Hydra vulgaris]